MTSVSHTRTGGSGTITTGKLVQLGIVAAIVAAVANMLVYYIVPALFDFDLEVPLAGPDSEIEPLPISMVIVAIIGATIGAIIVLTALKRFTRRPVTVFRVIAIIFLLLSLVPLVSLPVGVSIQLTLAAMHIMTASIITQMLTTS